MNKRIRKKKAKQLIKYLQQYCGDRDVILLSKQRLEQYRNLPIKMVIFHHQEYLPKFAIGGWIELRLETDYRKM